MWSRLRHLVPLSLVVATACASPPRNPPPETNRSTLSVGYRDTDAAAALDLRHEAGVMRATVPARLTAVWGVLPGVFEHLDIPVAQLDASAGTIGNPSFRPREIEGRRLSDWFDCGRGPLRPNADTYQVTISLTVQLLRVAADVTTLQTVVDAYARDRGVSGGSVHCISRGTLERRIADLVSERLGIETGA